MYSKQLILATLGLICSVGCAWSYGIAGAIYEPVPDPILHSGGYGNIAAAKAASSKLDTVNYPALHYYGHEIGKPLLIKYSGPLTELHSALAPKRSFVGTVDAGFYKDSYGKIKFRDETSIGAIAV